MSSEVPETGSKWICQLGLVWTCGGVSHGIVSLRRRDTLPGGCETYESFPLPVKLFWQVMKPVVVAS